MGADNAPSRHAALLEVAVEAARAAGSIALDGFHGKMEVRSKGGKDIVTQYDTAAEDAAIRIIRLHYPEHAILAEESGQSRGPGSDQAPYSWAVDPIDGTHNYAMQLPFWCTSVAVLNAARHVVAGAVFDPVHDELFTASHGEGARLNGARIHVSDTREVDKARAVSDIGYQPQIAQRMLSLAGWVQPRVLRLRVLGSAVLSLAYVAAGRFDVYYHLSLQPWDLAASSLLVREAGGTITDWSGQPLKTGDRSAVAANPALQPRILQLLHEGDPGYQK